MLRKMDSTNVNAAESKRFEMKPESPKKDIKSGFGDKAEFGTGKVDDYKRGYRRNGGSWKSR